MFEMAVGGQSIGQPFTLHPDERNTTRQRPFFVAWEKFKAGNLDQIEFAPAQ
jgi:hypothetical protein